MVNTNNELNILDLMTEKDVHQLKTNLLSVLNENNLHKFMEIQYSLGIFLSQGMELSCYHAIKMAKKLLLAGDHKQLPPCVVSYNAMGLQVSLMERMTGKHAF